MAKAKWENFTKEQIADIVANSTSNREVAERLGYVKDGGGTMNTLKKMYEKLKLDTSYSVKWL